MIVLAIYLNMFFAAMGIAGAIWAAFALFRPSRRIVGGILLAFLWGAFQVFFNYLACA